MSHQNSTFIPWPSFPALIGEEAYEQGGSPSDPVSRDMWRETVSRYPDGLPVPSDWACAEACFCWSVSGSQILILSVKRQQRGENPEEPEVSRGLAREFNVDDCATAATIAVCLKKARDWRSGWTPAEQARHARLEAQRGTIRAWLNAPDARTIPFFAAGGRVEITQALEAVASELLFHPNAPLLPAHIERARREVVAAIEQYPVAAPGLRELCKELGVPLS